MVRAEWTRNRASQHRRLRDQRGGVTGPASRRLFILAPLLLASLILLRPAVARALAYPDVGSSQWARTYIGWVTDQRIGGRNLLDDFQGTAFRPAQAMTRAQLARALVMASGNQAKPFAPRELIDVPAGHPYYGDIQRVLALGFMGTCADREFRPDQAAVVWQAHRSLVRMIRTKYPKADWSMLSKLAPVNWRPNDDWRPPTSTSFPSEVAARYLGLRFNHPASQDKLERLPTEVLRRDHAAYAFYQALRVPAWRVSSLSRFNEVTLPLLSARQKEILGFALRYEGYPHIYGGEYPTVNSPYGLQAHGGFDCSGFVWWVMKIQYGYPIPVTQRTAAAMAAAAKPRITRAKLRPGDILFWGPKGSASTASSIYHAGIYMGNGWFIHSTGSSAGVSIASLNWDGWSWKTDFAWGRRLLTASDLALPSPSPSPSPSSSAN